jgi:hypothetical protein
VVRHVMAPQRDPWGSRVRTILTNFDRHLKFGSIRIQIAKFRPDPNFTVLYLTLSMSRMVSSDGETPANETDHTI